jgi:hypothetical protein
MLDGLPERRTGVRQAVAQRPHVGVRIPVEDRGTLPADGIAQEMAVRRLVPPAQDDDEAAELELARHHLAQRRLVGVEVAGERHVAEVGGVLQQRDEPRPVTRIRREAMEPPAQLGGTAGRPGPAAVAPHALIGRKPHQHHPRGLAREHGPPEQLPDEWVLAVPVTHRIHRVSPSTTVCMQALGRR